MADILNNLLIAALARSTTEIASGNDLDQFKSVLDFRDFPADPYETSLELPCLLWHGQRISTQEISLDGSMTECLYNLTCQIYVETMGNQATARTFVTDALDTIETIFEQQNFDLSDHAITLERNDTDSDAAEAWGEDIASGSITFQHYYVNMRDPNRDGTAKMPVITTDASTAIPISSNQIRVQSDGGAVTHTATPTFTRSGLFWNTFTVWGNSDTDYVTLQDNSNLAGTLLHHLHARNVTLGLNDSITYTWDRDKGYYIEQSRGDSY